MTKISIKEALAAVEAGGGDFARLFERPSCDVSLYKPVGVDPQKPHLRDELYVIVSGSGHFECQGKTEDFSPETCFSLPLAKTIDLLAFPVTSPLG